MIDHQPASPSGVATETAIALAIHLFGPFEVRLHGRPLPRLRSRKGQCLLALLTLRHGGEVDRSWLAGTLWPDSRETAALASLRNCLKDLRRALGAEADRLRSPTPRHLSLDLEGAEADVVAFDAGIAHGNGPSLEQAIALYRGPLLAEWTEDWVFQERQAREQAYLTVLESLAHAAQAAGDRGAAERHLRRAAAVDPLRETAQRALMQALAASGNYAAATEVYRELRLRLHRELNAEPDAETQALYQQLRAAARDKAGVRGEGSGVSVRQRQRRPKVLVEADPRPLAPDPCLPHNLPLQLTRFIGREDQIAEVQQSLAAHRLVTLTGAGGCGKTRLALQVAQEILEQFAAGAWFVDLAALADASLVSQAVAVTLGVQEAPGRPLVQTLIDFLKPRQLLLVLDNCEHLIEACAQIAQALLQSCPSLRLLATSREPLGIPGERPYRVPSLSLPDAQEPLALEQFPQYEAVRLFIDRAAATLPAFRLTYENAPAVAEVCQRLGGIPLAIELAAVWVRMLTSEQIAARLDDRFHLLTGGSRTALPRQQTLRALIDWSYDLLSNAEQALLRRLSVFAGGWTLEAAEAVGSGGVPTDVLELLSRLVDKSLVIAETRATGTPAVRYRLLETVRQYARDRLLEEGEGEAARRRHGEFFLRLAEEAEPALRGPEQAVWLDRLEEEHDNLRAALAWSAESGEVDVGLRMGAALQRFWHVRGHFTEGRQRIERLLSRGDDLPPSLRAKALQGAWTLAFWQGDYALAHAYGEEGLALGRDAGAKRDIAWSLFQLGLTAVDQCDYERAMALATECLALAREVGDEWLEPSPLMILGIVARAQGDYERAKVMFADSLDLTRKVGDKWNIAMSLLNLGQVAQCQGDYEQATASRKEGLALCYELKNKEAIAWFLSALAGSEEAQGRVERGARLLGAVEGVLEAIGHSLSPILASDHTRHVAAARAALGEAAFAAAWAAGRAMPLEEAIQSALETD